MRSPLDPGRRGALLAAAALVVLAPLCAVVGSPAVAGAATGGPADITRTDGVTPLTSGTQATPYGVALPSDASCPGDSAHDGFRIYTYLVPASASPTEVNFKTGLPDRWWGYFADGGYVGALNTAESTGQVVGLPASFEWTRLSASQLLPGGVHSAAWNGGIACADVHGVVTTYWNTRIVFTADAVDPGGYSWRVVGEGALPGPSHLGLWIGIALLVLASFAAAFALRLRRSGDDDTSTPDGGEVASGDGPRVTVGQQGR